MTTTTQRTAWFVAAVAALAIAVPIAEPSPNRAEAARAVYSADQIIVRARPGVATARLREGLAARGLSLGARIPHTRLFAARTNGPSPAAAIRSLSHAAPVAAAMPNYIRRAFDVPNDPYFASAEPYLATIRMPQAWDLSHGSSGVVIAVVDSGVTPVADLAGQLLPGHNFVQDDDATFDEEPVPDSADARDTYGHGTFVAGIAAATTAPGALVFRVDGPPSDPRVGPSFNPVLKIYDHDLKLIATQDTSGFGEGERAVVRVRSAGRYYLRVANDAGARSPGSYSVAVTMRRSH